MGNIPEREQLLNEPRKGVTPFPNGVKQRFSDIENLFIESAAISLRDLGNLQMGLQQGKEGRLEEITNQDDQAFTIDLSGTIQEGNLRNFLSKGYYEVYARIDASTSNNEEENEEEATKQKLMATTWIHGTDQTIFGDFKWTGGFVYMARFRRIVDSGNTKKSERFVLPNSPEILQALRIKISNK